MSENSIADMLRELGRIRRAAAKRELRKRQATHLLNAAGYIAVVLAVVVILLSL